MVFKKGTINEIKIFLIKWIEGIAANKEIVPEVAQYKIATKLCELFNQTQDKITKWISIKMLVAICESGLLLDFIYRGLNTESVIVGMNTDTDVELGRVWFHLMSLFSQLSTKLQHNILSNIPRMKKYIFECLNDDEIRPEDKTEWLELVHFLVSDANFLKYWYDHDIETILSQILYVSENKDVVINGVLKTFIVLHASSVFNDIGIWVGKALRKNDGLKQLLTLYENKLSSNSISNWDIIRVFVQTIFMLNFDNKIVDEFKYTNVVALIEYTISRALEEENQNRLILECLKVCSFYSQDESLWPQMITRPFIKSLFIMLGLKDKDEKRYPLSILNDILASPIAFKYIKELPYKEGMNKLYTLYPKDQVETILTKIYEEHKSLQGLPVPSDYLTKHPYMKNLGVISKNNPLKIVEEEDYKGKHFKILTIV